MNLQVLTHLKCFVFIDVRDMSGPRFRFYDSVHIIRGKYAYFHFVVSFNVMQIWYYKRENRLAAIHQVHHNLTEWAVPG